MPQSLYLFIEIVRVASSQEQGLKERIFVNRVNLKEIRYCKRAGSCAVRDISATAYLEKLNAPVFLSRQAGKVYL
jgi:hypothetical protein